MHAPSKAEAATDIEIVRAIADALKPWRPQYRQIETGKRAGWLIAKSSVQMRADISKTVREEISRFRVEAVPHFFSRDAIRKTRGDARDLIKLIDRLTKQLSAATLSPELRLRLGEHDRVIGSPADIGNMPVPRLLHALKEIRDICQAADDNQPQTDEVKRWCALIAFRLVRTFSSDDPSAGSDKTAYCIIAGLLYESVTGKEERLRGVCQSILEPYQPLLRG
jgi:hypothetical protein